MKAEARIANERLSKLETRVARMAEALHRLIAARDEQPSDSENE